MNSQTAAETTTPVQAPSQFRSAPARGSIWRKPVIGAFEDMKQGRLDLILPEGDYRSFGRPGSDASESARMRIRSDAFFARCALYGDLGFAESYLDGEWETDDLTAVVGWFIRNLADVPGLSGSRPARPHALNLLRGVNRIGHWIHRNTRAQARRNIEAHYDLSNDFFALFLNPR